METVADRGNKAGKTGRLIKSKKVKKGAVGRKYNKIIRLSKRISVIWHNLSKV